MLNVEKMEGYVNPNQAVSGNRKAVDSKSFWDALSGHHEAPSYSNEKITNELRYARSLQETGKFRSKPEGRYPGLYEWNESNWDRVEELDALGWAWNWLKKHAPSKAKDSHVNSLHRSSLYELERLPNRPSELIIPLKNLWLTVTKDHQLKIQTPDPQKGVTFHIKAALKADGHEGYYHPKPLPKESWFNKFLNTSLPKEDVQQLVQEYIGYTLTNDVRFQKAQVWVGNGCNGKSVLLKIVSALHARVGAICLDRLTGFGVTPIVDSSLLISAETPKRGINEQEMKKIITGDSVTVEYKNRDLFTYNPTAKMLIACNRFPQISDETDGVWRRLQIINWDVTVDQSQQITNLDNLIINEELDLVVDWCLEGLLRLLRRGRFEEPASVVARKAAERQSSNSVLAFIGDCGIRVSANGETQTKESLYNKYGEFCERNGLVTYGPPEFWKRVHHNFPKMTEQKKGSNGRRYRVVNLCFGSDLNDEVEPTPFDDMKGGV